MEIPAGILGTSELINLRAVLRRQRQLDQSPDRASRRVLGLDQVLRHTVHHGHRPRLRALREEPKGSGGAVPCLVDPPTTSENAAKQPSEVRRQAQACRGDGQAVGLIETPVSPPIAVAFSGGGAGTSVL